MSRTSRRSVLRQAIAHEPPQLVVAQVVDVIDVFEVMRHHSPRRGNFVHGGPVGRRR
jgi:hypothetical protein